VWRCVLVTNVPDERVTSIFTSPNLKMEAVYSSETILTTYQPIQRHITEVGAPNLEFTAFILFFRGVVKCLWTGHNRREFVNTAMKDT
jgi:hypothetical protein